MLFHYRVIFAKGEFSRCTSRILASEIEETRLCRRHQLDVDRLELLSEEERERGGGGGRERESEGGRKDR